MGWVREAHAYPRPTRQVAIRTPKKDGRWLYWVLIVALSDEQLFYLAHQPVPHAPTPEQIMFAALYAYDLRSGGVETSIRGSKRGLGITKRNKRSFCAQEMLVLLAQLAYNLITWIHTGLADAVPSFQPFGPLRMVRDVFQIMGRIRLDAQDRVLEITLSEAHLLSLPFTEAMSSLLAGHDMSLNLGQI